MKSKNSSLFSNFEASVQKLGEIFYSYPSKVNKVIFYETERDNHVTISLPKIYQFSLFTFVYYAVFVTTFAHWIATHGVSPFIIWGITETKASGRLIILHS